MNVFRASRCLRSFCSFLPSFRKMLKLTLFAALAAILSAYGLVWTQVFIAVFAVYFVTGGWRYTWVVIRTLPRDVQALFILICLKIKLRSHQRSNQLVYDVFRDCARKNPDKVAFVTEEQEWTFKDFDKYSNVIGNYFYEAGFKKGDTVALFLENTPEMVAFWLGLSKVGCIGALINFNLKKESLAHCVNVSDAKVLVFSVELSEAVRQAQPYMNKHIQLFSFGVDRPSRVPCTQLDPLLKATSSLPPPVVPGRDFKDKLFYIYTSGTTGLPKAAIITNSRFLYMTYGMRYAFGMRASDIIYCTMPLYHSAGGIVGVGQVLIGGTTMAVRKKFSASRFFDDCVKFNATIVQYIGEICRYLLATPSKPSEGQHRVRMAIGNGLRPNIWEEFCKRFNIKKIAEFYGATEGNSNVVNMDGRVGAIGFNSRILPSFYPVSLIKVDEDTGEVIRDSNGLCIACKPGEPGQLIGKIVKGDPTKEFHGYVNQQATSKKIGYDIFKHGDSAFLSGDILVMDDYGYMYFKDRAGDTFRWRGENVSTTEVESTISKAVKLNDAVVYGVEVPGLEGRAGMAAIVDETGHLDLVSLNHSLKNSLPAYARPVFIRVMNQVNTTGTFKLVKTDLRKEAFNPKHLKPKEKLFFLDGKVGEYAPIDGAVYAAILSGSIRL
ncbi:long-chain fatty acid transport protein 1-like [Amphiura filiformis]|uniref:long-chain fatty acid transport protein 1-like n=1 Tax=Amphiura filiformis TaxID=82378 RepID=UPI003B21853F